MFTLFNVYERPAAFAVGLLVITVWSLVWKGLGLWHSGKHQQKWWFIAMLVLNTVGLLPIVYLIWFKPKDEKVEELPMPEKPVVKKKAKKKKK